MQILNKLLTCSAAAVAVKMDGAGKTKELCRPSQLPLYGGESCTCRQEKNEGERSSLEQQIHLLRKELWIWYDYYKGYQQRLIDSLTTAKAHSEFTLEYLKEESNYLPRYGAISLGGLSGLIFGLRGGWFRRVTYATTGTLAMAALCYPRQASEISHEGLTYAKKYVAITYNFIYGVKPDAPSLSRPTLQAENRPKKQHTETVEESTKESANKTKQEKAPTEDEKMNKVGGIEGSTSDEDLYPTRTRK